MSYGKSEKDDFNKTSQVREFVFQMKVLTVKEILE